MKFSSAIIALLFAILSLNVFAQQTYEPFVVIELYTSEGCSSCPPADDFLTELVNHDLYENKNVIPIAEHVTYWDYLGWADEFGQEKFDTRQSRYHANEGLSSIWTPGFVVNGDVWQYNQDGSIQTFIDKKYAEQAAANVELEIKYVAERSVVVGYEIETDIDAILNLNIVLTEDGLSNYATRGENAGKTLKHDYVARYFETIQLSGFTGELTIPVPEDSDIANCAVRAFVSTTDMIPVGGTKGIELGGVMGIEDGQEPGNLCLFPNPATNLLTLQTAEAAYSFAAIYDAAGEKIFEFDVSSADESIDVSSLPAGVYLLVVSDRAGVAIETARFVKM